MSALLESGAELERRCHAYLEGLRWRDGVRCARCDSERVFWIPTRRRWECRACRHQFRVTSGTALHNTHLPLWKWLVAIHLLLDSKDGFAALQLHGGLGGSYKSHWFACHRIRSALAAGGPRDDGPLEEADRELWDAVAAAAALPVAPRRRAAGDYAAGPYHQIGAGYERYYAAERRFRARHDDRVRRCRAAALALLEAEPLELRVLVGGAGS